MDHKWTHGFQARGSVNTYVPNALLTAGLERALRLWAGQNVSGWSHIRLLDSLDAEIATAQTTNTVDSGQLRAAATFKASDMTAESAKVQLLAGAVVVSEAALVAPADQALVVTRVDSLVEA